MPLYVVLILKKDANLFKRVITGPIFLEADSIVDAAWKLRNKKYDLSNEIAKSEEILMLRYQEWKKSLRRGSNMKEMYQRR
jgi:hypothetical protein